MCPNVSRLQWVVLFRDAWSSGGSIVFLLFSILLSTSLVLLRATYLSTYIVLLDIITLLHQMFLYITMARLTA